MTLSSVKIESQLKEEVSMSIARNYMFRKLAVVTLTVLASLAIVNCAQATSINGNMTVDNAFYAYVSTNNAMLGTLVASGNSWPTTFSLSAALTPGVTNYLQIVAINYGGPGAFIGDFSLSGTGFQFANGSQNLLTDTTNWAGGYNSSNSSVAPQPWVVPAGGVYSQGANGVGPWGTVSGVSSSALWIWPSDANSTGCAFCTVDFSTAITPTSVTPEPGTMIMFGSGILGLAGVLRRKISL